MKLSKTTLILLLLALGLGGFVYFYEIRGATQREEAQENKQRIFSFNADDVQSLTVKTPKLSLELERNSQPQPKWLLKSPVSEPANDAIVSYLMDLVVKGKTNVWKQDGKLLSTLSIPPNQASDFGFNQPQATINIKLKNQKNHQIILGNPNFNRSFVYAQVDPTTQPNGNINIYLLSTDFENAVNRELSEWKQSTNQSEQKPTPTTPQATPTSSQ